MTSEDYVRLLAQRFSGRKVILATGMVRGAGRMIGALRSLGAQKPLLLAEGMGTGDMPGDDELTWKILNRTTYDNLMDNVRAYQEAVGNPSQAIVDAVEAYDPDCTAMVIGALFNAHPDLLGRPVYGQRPHDWCALEDKVIIDALWDELGVARAECEIVACEQSALRAASARMDRGAGTVWAGDAKQGWHGGAELTRWVRDDAAIVRVSEFFWSRCDTVRVMPFLEGIPCSIHGIVFPDYVAALRPVEAVTLRRPELARFRYCGCATFWDPPDQDRDYMRTMAKRVGAALRDRVGFRGTFTIDGVMTEDGFRPTELNPRFGAGINTIAKALPQLPCYLVNLAICEGEAWDFQPRQFEHLLIAAADDTRTAHLHAWCPGERDQTDSYSLVDDSNGSYVVAPDGATAAATLLLGSSPIGTLVRLSLDAERNTVGQSSAPQFAKALAFADRHLGTEFGPSLVARSVR